MAARSGPRPVSAAEAVASVESGMRVRFVLGHTPMLVAEALAARAPELRDVEIVHSAAGVFPWFASGFEDSFQVVQEHWAGPQAWPMMIERRFDYMPMPFSLRFKAAQEPGRRGEGDRIPDVVCVQTSPPDERGMINLGPRVWDAPEYMRRAKVVIAEIDPTTPILCGDGEVPADLVTYFVEGGATPPYPPSDQTSSVYERLGEHLASTIADGDTLQIGAGTASVAAGHLLARLGDRNDLGWHSEATMPGVPGLIRSGVMSSSRVDAHPGVAVATHWVVPDDHRQFMERNPAIQGWEVWRVADPRVVASIRNFRAMNSVMMVDLTGQAAAESVGTVMRSGVGGLLEFMIGSLWSEGGSSVLVVTATDDTGTRSRIVPVFPEATQGTIPRTLVDMVVTEYGIAHLWGKTARERATELIRIAAPQFRDELHAAARKLFYP